MMRGVEAGSPSPQHTLVPLSAVWDIISYPAHHVFHVSVSGFSGQMVMAVDGLPVEMLEAGRVFSIG